MRSEHDLTVALSSALAAAADAANRTLDGDLRHRWKREPRDVAALELRPYQVQALASWNAFSQRGVIALPTGAGKTRVAIAAIFETGLPAAILCPTKALAQAWIEELRRQLPGQEIGLVGDGRRSIERVTVLTFESAYRHMDALGDRFGLIVVDEAHHFGSGARIEALEASAAVARLGLTATAPEPGTDAAGRLESLIGPTVFEMGYRDLVGTHLAKVSTVRIPIRLEVDERAEYETRTRVFLDTVKYGHALARWFPALTATHGWSLAARVLLGGETLGLELDAAAPIPRVYDMPRAHDSKLEAQLESDLRRLGSAWPIEREVAVVRAAGRLMFPDFALVSAVGRVLVELAGWWTPEYIAAKLELLRAARVPLVLCMDARHAATHSALAGDERVILFEKRLDASVLLTACERTLGRS